MYSLQEAQRYRIKITKLYETIDGLRYGIKMTLSCHNLFYYLCPIWHKFIKKLQYKLWLTLWIYFYSCGKNFIEITRNLQFCQFILLQTSLLNFLVLFSKVFFGLTLKFSGHNQFIPCKLPQYKLLWKKNGKHYLPGLSKTRIMSTGRWFF